MKKIVRASILALSLLSFGALQPHTHAQTVVQSASGTYRFALEDRLVKYFEFDSQTDERGVTTGYMTFTDDAKYADTDNDGDPDPRSEDIVAPIYVKADFDNMTVEKNRAVMYGVVVDSSHRYYIGRWVQLIVEDGGDDLRVPDKLTWAICRQMPGGWVPSDSERKYDDGAYLSWWATDAERKDDVGIPSKNLIPGETRGCEPFPLWTYAFDVIKNWEGAIRVMQQ